MTTAAAELAGCPRAAPSPEQEAVVDEIAATARRLEPGLPPFTLRWVDGRAVGRFAETIVYGDRRVVIVLRTDLPPSVLAGLMAHELGHAIDGARGRPLTEDAADEFAAVTLARWRTDMATGVTIATGTGRCSRCKGRIVAGQEYTRVEDDTGSFVSGTHVSCPTGTTVAHHGPRGATARITAAAMRPGSRCDVCGAGVYLDGRSALLTCGGCRRTYGHWR